MYCKRAGAAAEYCTRAEECVVGSTTPVRRGGGAELQGRGPRKCTVRSRGRNRVPYGGGGVCGGVHNTRPSGGGGATGARPAESDRG